MSSGSCIVREVRAGDVAALREACFSLNTLEQVQSRVEATIRERREQEQGWTGQRSMFCRSRRRTWRSR